MCVLECVCVLLHKCGCLEVIDNLCCYLRESLLFSCLYQPSWLLSFWRCFVLPPHFRSMPSFSQWNWHKFLNVLLSISEGGGWRWGSRHMSPRTEVWTPRTHIKDDGPPETPAFQHWGQGSSRTSWPTSSVKSVSSGSMRNSASGVTAEWFRKTLNFNTQLHQQKGWQKKMGFWNLGKQKWMLLSHPFLNSWDLIYFKVPSSRKLAKKCKSWTLHGVKYFWEDGLNHQEGWF